MSLSCDKKSDFGDVVNYCLGSKKNNGKYIKSSLFGDVLNVGPFGKTKPERKLKSMESHVLHFNWQHDNMQDIDCGGSKHTEVLLYSNYAYSKE